MAYILTRETKSGVSYTVYSRDKNGKRKSMGTFHTAQEAEALIESDATVAGTQDFSDFVMGTWLLAKGLEPATKRNYESVMRNHILHRIGGLKVNAITRTHVRKMLSDMAEEGVSAPLIHRCKAAVGSAFSYLIAEQVVDDNPAHDVRVRVGKPQPDDRPVLMPDDVRALLAVMPTEGARLFTSMMVETGGRFGEVSELRYSDIDWRNGAVYIRRAVADVGFKYHPDGDDRFYVKMPKGNKKRYSSVSPALLESLKKYAELNKIIDNNLLFSVCSVVEPGKVANPDFTKHLSKELWRSIWRSAVRSANLGWKPRVHDLRHAHATWLLKAGMDLHEVKERLGHASITTTEVYLHRLRQQESAASSIVGGLLNIN